MGASAPESAGGGSRYPGSRLSELVEAESDITFLSMKTSLPLALALLAANSIPELRANPFQEPIQITSEGSPLFVESPGYATPCLADVDGDGIKDLLVGQFRDGKISLYRGRKSGATDFGPATWVTASGSPVKVPGVW